MPCPLFHPTQIATESKWLNGRWPLIDEFEGHCTASGGPELVRSECCNHGYPRAVCHHFPLAETRSAMRYAVLRHSLETLDILCIEEKEHRPGEFYELQYAIAAGALAPAQTNATFEAQALAFCRSYLAHFGHS